MRFPIACIIGLVAVSLSVPAVAKSSGSNKQSNGAASANTSTMRKAGGDPKSTGKPLTAKKSKGGMPITKQTDKASPAMHQ